MFNFWKKQKSSDTPLQQQTVSGSNSGQIAQAGGSVTQSQNSVQSQATTGLLTTEIVELISQIVEIVKQSELSSQEKEEAISGLKFASKQAEKESPDKNFIAQTFKQIIPILKSAQNIYSVVEPILEKIEPWLGISLL